MPNKCEKLSDKWWVMSDEWWKLSDKKKRSQTALNLFLRRRDWIFDLFNFFLVALFLFFIIIFLFLCTFFESALICYIFSYCRNLGYGHQPFKEKKPKEVSIHFPGSGQDYSSSPAWLTRPTSQTDPKEIAGSNGPFRWESNVATKHALLQHSFPSKRKPYNTSRFNILRCFFFSS